MTAITYNADEYPEGHSPFCHRSCDDPCHDAYDQAQVALRECQGCGTVWHEPDPEHHYDWCPIGPDSGRSTDA